MRSDLAALIPPLVMAAAFVAGVVALLRREMAPRRRRHKEPPQQLADLPVGERGAEPGADREAPPVRSSHGAQDRSAENSPSG
jgi:hypothetical protein